MVTSGAQNATDPSAFTVTSTASPGHISYQPERAVDLPARPHRLPDAHLHERRRLRRPGAAVRRLGHERQRHDRPAGPDQLLGSSVQVLGIENTRTGRHAAARLSGHDPDPVRIDDPQAGAEINFSLQVITGDSTPMNWSSLGIEPPAVVHLASRLARRLRQPDREFGSTTASYLAYLDSEATYLSQLGEYTDDVQRLFGFAINTANDALTTGSIDSVTDASFPVPGAIPLVFDRQFNASISGRDTMGPFGFGWTDNWQISASADSQGNVTISDDGSLLYFAKNSDGSYTPAPGEYGTLTLTSGAYQYVQTDGTIIAFNTNGSLELRARHQRQPDHGRLQLQRRAHEPDRLERLGDHDRLQRAGPHQLDHRPGRPDDHLHLRRQRPAPADVHRRVRQDDLHLRDRPDRGRRERADLAHLRRRHGHRVVLRRPGPAGEHGPARWHGARGRDADLRLSRAGGYTVTDADGNTTTHLIDDAGNCCTIIDPLGNITRYRSTPRTTWSRSSRPTARPRPTPTMPTAT